MEDYVGYPVTSVSMTMDCQCILVGTQDSTLRLFDSSNGELLNKYTGHVNQAYKSVTFRHCGTTKHLSQTIYAVALSLLIFR